MVKTTDKFINKKNKKKLCYVKKNVYICEVKFALK